VSCDHVSPRRGVECVNIVVVFPLITSSSPKLKDLPAVKGVRYPVYDQRGDRVAHRTFFSFHYEQDVWRAGVVRNSAKLKPNIAPEFIDASLWEEAKRKGDDAIKRLINGALEWTTVTAVLIGSNTSSRRWVKYEIQKSLDRGNGLFGIYVHNIKDRNGNKAPKGINPLPSGYRTYDWVYGDGYNNLGSWVDKAYSDAHQY
jgi:MTH538 TIR-like domain (DUF1863)